MNGAGLHLRTRTYAASDTIPWRWTRNHANAQQARASRARGGHPRSPRATPTPVRPRLEPRLPSDDIFLRCIILMQHRMPPVCRDLPMSILMKIAHDLISGGGTAGPLRQQSFSSADRGERTMSPTEWGQDRRHCVVPLRDPRSVCLSIFASVLRSSRRHRPAPADAATEQLESRRLLAAGGADYVVTVAANGFADDGRRSDDPDRDRSRPIARLS